MKQISLNINPPNTGVEFRQGIFIFFFQFKVVITILEINMKNAFKWVQTSLVLVQWFLRYTPRILKENILHLKPPTWKPSLVGKVLQASGSFVWDYSL